MVADRRLGEREHKAMNSVGEQRDGQIEGAHKPTGHLQEIQRKAQTALWMSS